MSQSLPVGRAAHVARSLWLRIFGTGGNPGASLTDVKGFLDVLQWRANDEINEMEFTHLVAQWTKHGRKAKRRGVVAEAVTETDFRVLLARRGHPPAVLDLFLGLLINENNKSLLAAFPAMGHDTFHVTPEWLGAAETLFFALDTAGRGTIDFPQVEMFTLALLNWHLQFAGEIATRFDDFDETLRQRTFDTLRDMGATTEGAYHYVGVVGLDAFKHFLLSRGATTQCLRATLKVLTAFGSKWGLLRTKASKRDAFHLDEPYPAHVQNVPHVYELAVGHGRRTSQGNTDVLPAPSSFDAYLLLDAPPIVWDAVVKNIARARQRSMFHGLHAQTKIDGRATLGMTREEWSRIAGDLWRRYTESDGVQKPQSFEQLLQDGRAHRVLGALSDYDDYRSAAVDLFVSGTLPETLHETPNSSGSTLPTYEEDGATIMPLLLPAVFPRGHEAPEAPASLLADGPYITNAEENGREQWTEITMDNLLPEGDVSTVPRAHPAVDRKPRDSMILARSSPLPMGNDPSLNDRGAAGLATPDAINTGLQPMQAWAPDGTGGNTGDDDGIRVETITLDTLSQGVTSRETPVPARSNGERRASLRDAVTPELSMSVEKLLLGLQRAVNTEEQRLSKSPSSRVGGNERTKKGNEVPVDDEPIEAFDVVEKNELLQSAFINAAEEGTDQGEFTSPLLEEVEGAVDSVAAHEPDTLPLTLPIPHPHFNGEVHPVANIFKKSLATQPREADARPPPRVSTVLRALPKPGEDGGRTLMHGKMMKKGGGSGLTGRRNWKEREFLLVLHLPSAKVDGKLPKPFAALEYFDEKKHLMGTVIVDAFSTVEPYVEKSSKYEFCFGIRRKDGARSITDSHHKCVYPAKSSHVRSDIDLRAESKNSQLAWEKMLKRAVSSCNVIEGMIEAEEEAKRHHDEDRRNEDVHQDDETLEPRDYEDMVEMAEVKDREGKYIEEETTDGGNGRQPNLVASLLAEIDEHLDGTGSSRPPVSSPFIEEEDRGLSGLDGEAGRRAKSLREALRSMKQANAWHPKDPVPLGADQSLVKQVARSAVETRRQPFAKPSTGILRGRPMAGARSTSTTSHDVVIEQALEGQVIDQLSSGKSTVDIDRLMRVQALRTQQQRETNAQNLRPTAKSFLAAQKTHRPLSRRREWQ